MWGVPVIASTAITEGTFLVGDWAMGAQVWDRKQATVQISFEDGNNFTKNMATILCEERLALTVYRPKAFRSGLCNRSRGLIHPAFHLRGTVQVASAKRCRPAASAATAPGTTPGGRNGGLRGPVWTLGIFSRMLGMLHTGF